MPPSPKPKAFIVDDDDAVRDSIALLLELHGLETEAYASIAEFAGRFRKPAHGCLILDQHLPRMTGLEFLESEAGRALGLPVILLTGHGSETLMRRALRNGVTAFLDKPVREEVLLETVNRVLGRGQP